MNGNSIGDEGVRALISGLSLRKGIQYAILSSLLLLKFELYQNSMHLLFSNFINILTSSVGKLALLDIGNNSITAKGVFHVAEFVKRTKSLVLLNLFMNDISDEVTGINSKIALKFYKLLLSC